MSELITATLNVSYASENNTDGKGLTLELHKGFTGMTVGIAFRQYPQCNAKLVCSYGTFSDFPQYQVSNEKEVVVFSGSSTANLKRPAAENVSVELIRSVAYSTEGDVVIPNVTFDSDKQQLVSDIAFYGAVHVTYQAPYLLHFYIFKTEYDPVMQQTSLFGDDVIHAFYKTQHAELKMENNFVLKEQWMPLYKITSKVVLDDLGIWEYPPSWESVDNANYSKKQDDPSRQKRPDGSFGSYSSHVIDPDMSFTDTRVHQIGEYDFVGRVKTSSPNDILGIQEPYWEHFNSFDSLARAGYLKWHLQFAQKPTWKRSMNYSEQVWMEAWASIDKDDLEEELKHDFYNLVVDGGG